MKNVFAVVGVMLFSLSSVAIAESEVSGGITCEATKPASNGIKPFVTITQISDSQATLSISLDSGLPDIRTASLKKVPNDGVMHVGYLANISDENLELPIIGLFTNGSTSKNTTQGLLVIEDREEEFEMICKEIANQ